MTHRASHGGVILMLFGREIDLFIQISSNMMK